MSSDIITGEKSPGVALTLNLCIPFFIGYFYIGQWAKALICLGISIITGGTFWPIFWIISIFDAYAQAKVLKKGGAIGQFTFFSSAVHVPAPHPTYHQPPAPGYPHPAHRPASDQVSQVVHDVGKEIEGILEKAKPSSKKVCLSCGQQIDVRYMVCPFCQAPVTGAKQPGSGVIEY